MSKQTQLPEEKRERIRQEELNSNPLGALRDGLHRGEVGNLSDLTGGFGWKGTAVLIVIFIVGYIGYKLLF